MVKEEERYLNHASVVEKEGRQKHCDYGGEAGDAGGGRGGKTT